MEVEQFRQSLSENLAALISDDCTQPVRVMVFDETRIGMQPIVRNRITAKGIKPIQIVNPRYESYYLYGAVEPTTGERFVLEMPALDTDCFEVFLKELAHSYMKDLVLLILDNGAFHKAQRLVVPQNIRLLFLPPYAPELNPIERFWQEIKKEIAFPLFATLQQLKDAVAQILNRYTSSAIAQITSYPYIIEAINALSI